MSYSLGDAILLNEVEYTIEENIDGYYLNHPQRTNTIPFTVVGIDEDDDDKIRFFVQSIVGYKPGDGAFPEVKSLEDMNKIIDVLKVLNPTPCDLLQWRELKPDSHALAELCIDYVLKTAQHIPLSPSIFKQFQLEAVTREQHCWIEQFKPKVKLNKDAFMEWIKIIPVQELTPRLQDILVKFLNKYVVELSDEDIKEFEIYDNEQTRAWMEKYKMI